MKIVFINPPIRYSISPLPPLGIAYLAAVLRANGYPGVGIIDGAAEFLKEEELVERVLKESPDVIGFSVMSNVASVSQRLSKSFKEKLPGALIVWGGAHATALPENCLRTGVVDLVFRHEAEESLLSVIRCLDAGKDFSQIKGIAYLRNAQMVCNERASRLTDLDALPFPARDLLPMDRYATSSWFSSRVAKSTTLLASRGCPYDCTYCANKVSWGDRRYVSRSVVRVVDEMALLRESYGVNGFQFSDECLTANRDYTKRFCEEILNRGLKVSWVCSSFVTNVTQELLCLMKRAGCEYINFGIESGCYEVRQRMRKYITDEHITHAVSWAKEAGLRVGCCFLLGCPEETADQARQTIKMAQRLAPHEVAFNIVVPFPGTDLYKNYVEPTHKDLDWDDAMGFDPMRPDTPKVFFNCSRIPDRQLISLYREARRKVELNPLAIGMMLNRLRHAKGFKHLWVIIKGGIKLLIKH